MYFKKDSQLDEQQHVHVLKLPEKEPITHASVPPVLSLLISVYVC